MPSDSPFQKDCESDRRVILRGQTIKIARRIPWVFSPIRALPTGAANQMFVRRSLRGVTVARISVLLNVIGFRRLQLSEGVPRVFQKLHLS
jgi:hypothetical protein